MGEETAVKTEEATTDTTLDGNVTFSTDGERAADTVPDPLFDDEESFTDEELTNVSIKPARLTGEGKETATPPPEVKEGEEKKDGETTEDKAKEEAEPEAKAKEEADKKATEEKEVEPEVKDGDKPPPGHVPLGALHEERARTRELKSELDQLRQEFNTLKTAKPALDAEKQAQEEKVSALQGLTEKLDELRKLKDEALDDTVGTVEKAIDGIVDTISALTKSMEEDNRKRDEAEQARQRKTEEERVIEAVEQEGYRKMEQFVPGILAENSPVNAALSTFAQENGISKGFLRSITNPATTIVTPGGEAQFLGDDAAFFVAFLNSAKTLSNTVNEDAVAAAVKEAEPKWREKFLKEEIPKLIDKLKRGESLDEFKSLGELPGSATVDTEEIFSSNAMLSETEFSKLSEADRERYLMG